MNRKAQYSKNAGLTLVELLVAITMLAIIVVPLLHAFASSARVGLKARQRLRVTTAAQDIMEGLKAESIESLSCAFNYPDDDVNNILPGAPIARNVNSFKNFHLVDGSMIGQKNSAKVYELRASVVEDETSHSYRNVSGLSDISALRNVHMDGFGSDTPAIADQAASTKQTADEQDYEFFAKSDKKYYFAIQDMRIDATADSANFTVDALIELNGINYTSMGDDIKTSIDPSENLVLLNEKGRINYGATDPKRDAFYLQDEATKRFAAQEFTTRYRPDTDCEASDLSQKFVIVTKNRTVDTAMKSEDGTNDWIQIKCYVTYQSSSAFLIPHTHEDYDVAKGGNQPYTKTYEYTIFDNKATGYAPENIYFCYFPGYGAEKKDEIIYVNEDKVPTTLHVVKQERKNNGTLNHDEIGYKCSFVMNEGTGATESHAGIGDRSDSVTPIRTNLDNNLYKIYMPSAPDCKNQATYTYNGTKVVRNFSNPKALNIFPLGGEEADADQMYDVTIDIYEAGTLEDAFSTGNIDNDSILFTLKGSMN